MKNDPAFPQKRFPGAINVAEGLTKREMFAAMVLQGLSVMAIPGSHNSKNEMVSELPEKAVALADALIAELEKEK